MLLNFFLIFVLIVIYFWKDTTKPKNYPPGPPWLPLIGNMFYLHKLVKMHKHHYSVWQHLSRVYGPIAGIRLGNDRIVIVSGKDAIKEFYSREEFDGRPDGFFFRVRSFNKRLGLVFVDSQPWEVQRRFSVKTLKNLGMGKTGMVMHIEREAAEIVEYFKKKVLRGNLIEMSNSFDVGVLNVMWTLIAGKRFDLEDVRLQVITKLTHESFRIIDMSGGILNRFPFLRYIIPNKSGYLPLVNTLKPLWIFLKEAINDIKASPSKADECNSLIEAYLRELENENHDSSFTEDQLLALCLDFFQAGSETTSNTLGFGFIYMLHNPQVVRNIWIELDSVVGRNRLPALNDRSNLPYTEAVICEIQRMANVAPLAIAHRSLSNVKLGSFVVPQDTISIVSLYSLHMDSDYWGDPTVFRPERFIDSCSGQLIQHEYFLPFGSGKRRCMGENLAKSSLFLYFASFMHSFEIHLPTSHNLPEIEGSDGITLSPKPFQVILKERTKG